MRPTRKKTGSFAPRSSARHCGFPRTRPRGHQIAALAAVSKRTVYKHFADNEHLFSEIVISTVNEASGTVYDKVRNLQTAATSKPICAI